MATSAAPSPPRGPSPGHPAGNRRVRLRPSPAEGGREMGGDGRAGAGGPSAGSHAQGPPRRRPGNQGGGAEAAPRGGGNVTRPRARSWASAHHVTQSPAGPARAASPAPPPPYCQQRQPRPSPAHCVTATAACRAFARRPGRLQESVPRPHLAPRFSAHLVRGGVLCPPTPAPDEAGMPGPCAEARSAASGPERFAARGRRPGREPAHYRARPPAPPRLRRASAR